MQAFHLVAFDNGHQDIINPAFLPQMIAQEEADEQNYRVQLARPRPRCHQAISGYIGLMDPTLPKSTREHSKTITQQ